MNFQIIKTLKLCTVTLVDLYIMCLENRIDEHGSILHIRNFEHYKSDMRFIVEVTSFPSQSDPISHFIKVFTD